MVWPPNIFNMILPFQFLKYPKNNVLELSYVFLRSAQQ
jgi:hypothetical protein